MHFQITAKTTYCVSANIDEPYHLEIVPCHREDVFVEVSELFRSRQLTLRTLSHTASLWNRPGSFVSFFPFLFFLFFFSIRNRSLRCKDQYANNSTNPRTFFYLFPKDILTGPLTRCLLILFRRLSALSVLFRVEEPCYESSQRASFRFVSSPLRFLLDDKLFGLQANGF